MTIFTETSALAARPRGHTAFILLITVGTLLAAAVLLSKLAAEQGAPMLWYLTAAMSGSGVVLFATSRGAAAAPDRAPGVIVLGEVDEFEHGCGQGLQLGQCG